MPDNNTIDFSKFTDAPPKPVDPAPGIDFSKFTEEAPKKSDIDFSKFEQPSPQANEYHFFGGVEPNSMVSGMVKGLKAGVFPSDQTSTVPTNTKETLGSVLGKAAVASTAGVLAGSALTTLGVPTLAAAGVGGAIYGVYSGIASEIGKSKEEHRDFSASRAAEEVASQINMAIGHTTKALKLARVVLEGGISALQSYEADPNHNISASKVLIDMAAVGIGAKITMPNKAVGEAATKTLMEALETSGVMAQANAAFSKADKTIPAELPKKFINKFIGTVDAETSKHFDANWNNLSQAKRQELWDSHLLTTHVEEAATDVSRKLSSELGESVKDLNKVKALAYDPKFIGRGIDDKLGTSVEPSLDALSAGINKATTEAIPFQLRAVGLTREANKIGIDNRELGKLRAAGQSSDNPEVKQLLDGWDNLFKDMREYVVNKGYHVNDLPNYTPMKELSAPEFYNKFSQDFDHFLNIGKSTSTPLAKMEALIKSGENSEQEMKRFINFKRMASSLTDHEVSTFGDLKVAKNNILSGTKFTDKANDFSISMLYNRANDLPDDYREFDLGKLFSGYVSSNLKGLYASDGVAAVKMQADALAAAGLKKSSRYLNNLISDTVGGVTNPVTWGAWSKKIYADSLATLSDSQASILAKIPAHIKKFAYETLPYAITAGPHRNLLFGAKPIVDNGAQIATSLIPELTNLGNLKSAARFTGAGFKDTLRSLPDSLKRLEAAGMATSQEVFKNATEELSRGLRSGTGLMAKAVNANEAVGNAFMMALDYSEKISRSVTYNTGRAIGNAALNGDQEAIQLISKLPRGVRASLNKATLGDDLGRHLVGTTMYHYGTAQMSEMARWLGSHLAMFSKFPTYNISEIGYNLEKAYKGDPAGWRSLGVKMALPYMITSAMDYEYDEAGLNPDLKKALVGSGGVKGTIPVSSVANAIPGIGEGVYAQAVKEVASIPSNLKEGQPTHIYNKVIKPLNPLSIQGPINEYNDWAPVFGTPTINN
jgi:hypothetical protein